MIGVLKRGSWLWDVLFLDKDLDTLVTLVVFCFPRDLLERPEFAEFSAVVYPKCSVPVLMFEQCVIALVTKKIRKRNATINSVVDFLNSK